MKELHFYIQSIMLVVILATLLQDFGSDSYALVAFCLLFFLGSYQYGMSWFLKARLKSATMLLNAYLIGSNLYMVSLIAISIHVDGLDKNDLFLLYAGIPLGLAVFFIVVIEDLLWVRA